MGRTLRPNSAANECQHLVSLLTGFLSQVSVMLPHWKSFEVFAIETLEWFWCNVEMTMSCWNFPCSSLSIRAGITGWFPDLHLTEVCANLVSSPLQHWREMDAKETTRTSTGDKHQAIIVCKWKRPLRDHTEMGGDLHEVSNKWKTHLAIEKNEKQVKFHLCAWVLLPMTMSPGRNQPLKPCALENPSSQFPSYKNQQGIWFVIKPVACKTSLSINVWIFLGERELYLRPLQSLPHDASAMHMRPHGSVSLGGHQAIKMSVC